MTVYRNLLIETGGGIIDRSKQSPCKSGVDIIIGLGGIGAEAVAMIKREVFRQIQPDDVNAENSMYKSIRYLIIDSDVGELRKNKTDISDIDTSTEFFYLSNRNVQDMFCHPTIIRQRPELGWLNYENMRNYIGGACGASCIRQMGRFLLVDRAESVYSQLKNTILQATASAGNNKLTIHVCAGLAGGTGSGIFLDICYLLRMILEEIDRNAVVTGYFFMPDVHISKLGIQGNLWFTERLSENGYAALKELEYCMHFRENNDCFHMDYGFISVQSEEQPVDFCFLISATDSEGQMRQDGYEYALNIVSDFVVRFLIKAKLPDEAKGMMNGLALKGRIVPYAWQGIVDLKKRYDRIYTPGRHIFEGEQLNWNDILPDPIQEDFC